MPDRSAIRSSTRLSPGAGVFATSHVNMTFLSMRRDAHAAFMICADDSRTLNFRLFWSRNSRAAPLSLEAGADDDGLMLAASEAALASLDLLGAEDEPLALDSHTAQLLDSPERRTYPSSCTSSAAAAAAGGAADATAIGLRVTGLPTSLDEAQAKVLLSHFGPLAHFELQRGALSNTALLRYQVCVRASHGRVRARVRGY